MPQGAKVFISYVHNNKRTVRRLVADLKAAGINVWWDEEGLKAGAKWKREIREAINSGAFFIACFSRQYWERNAPDGEGTHMNEELLIAIERLRKLSEARKWFIPVCLSSCQVPDRDIGGGQNLRDDVQHVKLWKDWEQGVQRLVETILPEGPVSPGVHAELVRLKEPGPSVRKAASVEALIKALGEEDRDARVAAAEALKGIKDPRMVSGLIRNLDDKRGGVQMTAAKALGEIKDPRAVDALAKALETDYGYVRVAASEALVSIGPPAVDALIKALSHNDRNLRLAAAEALGEIKDPRAVDALIEPLGNLCLGATDSMEAVFVKALVSIGSPAIGALIKLLEHPICNSQVAALRALVGIGSPAVGALTQALQDENLHVRLSAANALGKIGDELGLRAVADAKQKRLIPSWWRV